MNNYCYNNKENLILEHDYKDEILCHLQNLTKVTKPDSNMMSLQPELEWYMRPYLIDFIIECHDMMKLSENTLYLTVNLIDRYASKRIIYKRHYQLVACSALWIASKYNHDDNIPTLNQLKTFSCNVYEPHMFIQMESHILNTLDWLVSSPTCDVYLDMDSKEDTSILRQLSNYICESSLYHKQFLDYTCQELVKCAFKISILILKFHDSSLFNNESPEENLVVDQTCFDLLIHASTIPSEILKKKYLSCYKIVEDFFTSLDKLQPDYITTTAASSYQQQSPRQLPSPVPSDSSTHQELPSIITNTTTTTNEYERNNGYITPPFTPA